MHWQILKILANGISQSFMLSLKCDHPLLCEFPILFSTVKLKLGHKLSQLIQRFNIWILKCWSGTVYISKFFSIHKRDGKLGFLKSLDCISKFSPIHWKVWKLRFLSPCLHIWSNGEGGLWVRCRAVEKRGGGDRGHQLFPYPTINWGKTFFPHKIIKHKMFTCE